MGMIGRWIDQKCQTHPEVMRRVLGRRFGTLAQFAEGDKCGCLVGSFELESMGRIVPFSERSHPDVYVGYAVSALTKSYATPSKWSEQVFRDFPHFNGHEKRSDEFVIRLLKQRIRKSLGIAPTRETEVPVGVGAGPTTETPQP
jgi:hypothetical protein